MITGGAKAKRIAQCLGLGTEAMYFPTNHALFGLLSGNSNGNISIGNNSMSIGIILSMAFLMSYLLI
jgi:hypothetical protein